jgi:hypothetical protein
MIEPPESVYSGMIFVMGMMAGGILALSIVVMLFMTGMVCA